MYKSVQSDIHRLRATIRVGFKYIILRVAVGVEFQFPFPQDFCGNSHRNPQERTRNLTENPTETHTESHRKSHTGFFKGDRGVKITPRILGVTPRFGSAAAAWAIFG